MVTIYYWLTDFRACSFSVVSSEKENIAKSTLQEKRGRFVSQLVSETKNENNSKHRNVDGKYLL